VKHNDVLLLCACLAYFLAGEGGQGKQANIKVMLYVEYVALFGMPCAEGLAE
jgi:hypothetical protein